MLERIRQLEKSARRLEPDAAARADLLQRVNAYAQHFLETMEEKPVFLETAGKGRGLYGSPLAEDGIAVDEALALLEEYVDTPGVNPASGRFLGYIPGGGLFHSALGDFLAAVSNRYAGVFFESPGAVRVENMLVDWMGDLVGYPESRGGTLTSGGSIANLVAIVSARDAHQIAAEEVRRAAAYMTEHTHHSIDKALRIAGLESCVRRRIPVDGGYRLRPQALEDAIRRDREAGLRPWLVVASAGSTNTGSVDPLEQIAGVARAHDLWLHVDGAYGAFFALCPPGREILKGMDRSDSLIMDPHKTLFLPYGTGAVLVRDRAKLLATHRYLADYMRDAEQATEEISPADASPELSRHFRGLRMWLPLKLTGLAPFRAALEEKMLLTRYFYERMRETPGFEVGPPPDLSVAVYRYLPRRGDPDAFNRRLAEAVQQDGRIFITSTVLDGNVALRAAIVSFRTHLEDVDLAIDVLTEKATELESTL